MKKTTPFPLLAALLFFAASLFGQSITPVNAPFIQGQPMTFNYSGGATTNDWIGIYSPGVVPDGDPYSLVWKYAPTAGSGQVTFPGSLPIGKYDIHLFCCDPSYNIIASYPNFEVVAEPFRSRLTYYMETDDIVLLASGIAAGDVLSVFHAADFSGGAILPGAVAVAEQTVATPSPIYPVKFNFSTLPSGEKYVGVLSKPNVPVASFSLFEVKPLPVMPPVITRFGIGSCAKQGDPQPTLELALSRDIDFFMFLGDNLYIDTNDTTYLKEAYEAYLRGRTEVQNVRASVPLFATWDDHDYGCCYDAGGSYPWKATSKQVFLHFWDEPANSPRWAHEGIYDSYYLGPTGQKLQVILLDTRYFLDDKKPNDGSCNYDYCQWPVDDTTHTMLGAEQWAWLKAELLKPADLRLITTSVQFSASYVGYESWTLFLQQQKKMQDLLIETHAEHAFFISGDSHYTEVSKNDDATGLYPLYDFTSSGINRAWSLETNANRVGNKVYWQPNVGIIDIDWAAKNFSFNAIDAANAVRFSHTIPFKELEFPTISAEGPGKGLRATISQSPAPGLQSAVILFEKPLFGEISLFDATGRVARRMETHGEARLEIANLLPGIYFAEFRGAAGVVALKVLVE